MAVTVLTDKVYFDQSGAGTLALLNAPTGPGAFIRVFSYHLSVPAAVATATWKYNTTGLFNDYPSATGGPVDVEDESGVIDLPPNTSLNLVTDATLGGSLRYSVIGAG